MYSWKMRLRMFWWFRKQILRNPLKWRCVLGECGHVDCFYKNLLGDNPEV